MRNLIVLGFIAATLLSGAWVIHVLPPPTAGSPEIIYPVHTGPGTGHAFRYGVEYTVVDHMVYDGKLHAIVTSGAQGEGHIQIWSPIPDLVVLAPGKKFQIVGAKNFSWALQVGDARP